MRLRIPPSRPRGWDLKYSPGNALRVRSRAGASADSIIPTSPMDTSSGAWPFDALSIGMTDPVKIAFISDGTPGRETSLVVPTLIVTPGAVPTGLGRGSAPSGNVAIFLRNRVRPVEASSAL